MDYSKLLNEEQLAPVYDTEGQILVLAGAGSGKTRVLTHRISYLLDEKGVEGYNILAITFTNKATREMLERVENITGRSDVWVSTFHSFCAKILRFEIEKLGYTSNYSIFTSSDSTRLINRILKALNVEEKESKIIKSHISNVKNMGVNIDEYCLAIGGKNSDLVREVYIRYEKELKENNALDFDDLLLKTVELFRKYPEVLEKYQERFKYIHIDEFQDTNKIQLLLVRMLAFKHQNLFVVGDDDQSIYGWRGAEVGNILNFKKYYPDCKIYKLQRNYRSTQNILDCANKVIAKNKQRMGKELWTGGDKGVRVEYKSCYNDKAEVDYVLGEIRSLCDYNGYSLSDFAILVRLNSLTRNFEESMNMYGIKYKLIGGFKFYDRKEILDTIAYLRVVANPLDSESIVRIINFPKRGIGDTAIQRLRDYCSASGKNMITALLEIEDNEVLTKAMKEKFAKFTNLIVDLMRAKLDKSFEEFAKYLLEKVDFYSAYDIDNPEDKNKLENIDEFMTIIHEYCEANEGVTLEDFMQSISLVSDTDEEEGGSYVTLATVHGVKGLEYKVVFIVGCEENVFPSSKALNNPAEMEEERRCMYVAITRAQERLYLTSAGNRFRFGKVEYNLVSRFVEEAELIKPDPTKFKTIKVSEYANIPKERPKTMPNTIRTDLQKDLSVFKVGSIVIHSRYGEGIITALDGTTATIAFGKLGNKNFNLELAPIKLKD